MRFRPSVGPETSRPARGSSPALRRSEEHTSELQSQSNLVCRLLLEKKKTKHDRTPAQTTTHDQSTTCITLLSCCYYSSSILAISLRSLICSLCVVYSLCLTLLECPG